MNVEREAAATATGSPTVFLSYARADQAVAEKLIAALQGEGFSVWWDGLIGGGHEFSEKIEQALGAAGAVVVLWSEQSKRSQWVRDEAGFARDHNRLVPVSIDGAEAPLGFRQINRINLKSWNGRADGREFQLLCQSIRSLVDGRPLERTLPGRGPTLSRRHALLGGGALALAAGAGGLWWLRGSPASATSVAVIPFRNLSGDPGQDYFSEGLAEELRTTLSQAEQLQVAAQASSDTFKDGQADAKTMARSLGVGFLVEGSVRRSPETIRVATRIVDGKSGLDRWSQTFDRPASDSLSVQSDIAAFVADAVLADLDKGLRPSERIGGTRKSDAFDAYLKGTALYRLAAGKDSDMAALAAFDQAVSIDPDYAAAHAARSRVLTVIANNYASSDQIPAYYAKSIDAARTAMRIAPDLAEGYSALGFALFNGQLDAKAAAVPYQRSYELGYGNADILSAYANFAGRTGRFDEAREAIARAARLDPLNATVFRNAGLIEYSARSFEAAASQFRTALSINPKSSNVHGALGDIALLGGDLDAALSHYEQERDPATRLRGIAIVKRRQADDAGADAAMAALVREGGETVHYQQAQVMAQWGRIDDALAHLEKALALRDAGLVRILNDPLLDPVRKEARFVEIERRMGFV
ncbi:TIR domain-containing protein [Sphingomonas jaspsi]|uniref:TIR domain-containing protein n=1 Tax=Sphingomonas jaspsi TaxID=392409 RepID=UPI0004B256AA|nr:TIR domain-containing protein [Sphingomonas jaspsi]